MMMPAYNKSRTTKNTNNFDVIVVGGGMVGLSVAAGLATRYKVAVIESSPLQKAFSKDNSVRVSAITRASEAWLKILNGWQQIPTQRLSAYQKMQIWDAQGSGELVFSCADIAEPNLGHIIENSVIQTSLLRAIEPLIESAQIKIFSGSYAQQVQIDRDEVSLLIEGEAVLTAKLLVAADGANSWLRKQLAFPMEIDPYQQSALVALVESEKNHQKTAWQRFLPSGPLAFLPMKQKNLHSIVWSLNEELVEEHLNSDEVEFVTMLQQAIDSQFGELKLVSKRSAFPLIARHASSYIQHRTVLVGDAAHTIHPLAGQGVNLGFLDARALVEILTNADRVQQDPGNKQLLRNYERCRKGNNQQVQKAMSMIKQGFASEQQAIVSFRNLGMNLVDKNTWIKKQLIKTAMGLS